MNIQALKRYQEAWIMLACKRGFFSYALSTFACPVWFDSTLAWWKVLRVGRPHVSYLHAAPKLAQVPIGRSGSPRLPGSLFIWDLENIGIFNCYKALVLLPILTWTTLSKGWAFLFNFSPPWSPWYWSSIDFNCAKGTIQRLRGLSAVAKLICQRNKLSASSIATVTSIKSLEHQSVS